MLITDRCKIATIYYPTVLICACTNPCTSDGLLVHMDKAEGPKLLYDAIGEWPDYMRLLLPILYILIDKKSANPVVQSSDCMHPFLVY